ncbi:MAG: hypothetical protein WCD52_20145 [Xanthobacteraceae bacterium]
MRLAVLRHSLGNGFAFLDHSFSYFFFVLSECFWPLGFPASRVKTRPAATLFSRLWLSCDPAESARLFSVSEPDALVIGLPFLTIFTL